MSEQNLKNKAQQKWRHRTGPVNFGVIREKLCATKENKEMSTQAEMFCKTRQSKKGDEQPDEAFQIWKSSVSLKSYQLTLLKRTEKITKIEKKHANELKLLNDKVLEMEAKHKQEMSLMEHKFQILLRNVINQN
ncbi:hypothetical protein Lal_00036492, partial [Lupinus albus]